MAGDDLEGALPPVTPESESSVIDLAAARLRLIDRHRPTWAEDIEHCCLYAEIVKTEHAAEQAQLRWDQRERDIDCWWEGPPDIQQRVHALNRKWEQYIGLLVHIAGLRATSRREARMKRNIIPRIWLKPDGSRGVFERMRKGCMADDHLFPPSLRMDRLKGKVRIS